MADAVEIIFDKKRLQELEDELRDIPKQLLRARWAAISKTKRTAKAQITRVVRERLALRHAALVKRRVIVTLEPTRANPATTIRVSGKLLSLKEYRVRQTAKGLSAKIFKDKSLQRLPGVFIAGFRPVPKRTKTGRKSKLFSMEFSEAAEKRLGGHVFSRRRTPLITNDLLIGKGNTSKRLPIHKLVGPSAAIGLSSNKVKFAKVINDIGAIYEKNLASQVDRFLERRRVKVTQA